MRATSHFRRSALAGIALTFVLVALVPAVAQASAAISDFNPKSGPVGTSVKITGSGFTGTTSVKFNGTAAGFSVNAGGTTITTTAPRLASSGPIVVTTGGVTATT